MFFLLQISFRHELANVENQFHTKVNELKYRQKIIKTTFYKERNVSSPEVFQIILHSPTRETRNPCASHQFLVLLTEIQG